MTAIVTDPKGRLLAGDPVTLGELVSNALGIDRTANVGDALGGGRKAAASDDRCGWWAAPAYGCRLWTLLRAGKATATAATEAQAMIAEALKPLQDQGVLGRVDVSVRLTGSPKKALEATIVHHKPTGERESVRYENLWALVR